MSDGLVADLDRQIEELQKQRAQFVEELPAREERREQLAGKAVMQAFRSGNVAAATWLERIVTTARDTDEGWLFEEDYLTADGYKQFKTRDGKTAWELRRT